MNQDEIRKRVLDLDAEQWRSQLRVMSAELTLRPAAANFDRSWRLAIEFYEASRKQLEMERTAVLGGDAERGQHFQVAWEWLDEHDAADDDIGEGLWDDWARRYHGAFECIMEAEARKEDITASLSLLREYTILRFGITLEKGLKGLVTLYLSATGSAIQSKGSRSGKTRPVERLSLGEICRAFGSLGVDVATLATYPTVRRLWDAYTTVKHQPGAPAPSESDVEEFGVAGATLFKAVCEWCASAWAERLPQRSHE